MDLQNAADVITESKTRSLVYNIYSTSEDIESITELSEYAWSISDLIRKLLPREYILLANTSRAGSSEEAIKKAIISRLVFKGLLHREDQQEPIIKLEVLDKSLQSDDDAVLQAMEVLISRYDMTVFPLISPSSKTLNACYELGVPMVRILAGKIGSLEGLIDKPKLRKLAAESEIPLFFEGGLGTADHAKEAFNLGATGVLMNAAFQRSERPIELAKSVRKVIDSFEQ
jgi:thiazole synthase